MQPGIRFPFAKNVTLPGEFESALIVVSVRKVNEDGIFKFNVA